MTSKRQGGYTEWTFVGAGDLDCRQVQEFLIIPPSDNSICFLAHTLFMTRRFSIILSRILHV